MKVVVTPMPGDVGPAEPEDVVIQDLRDSFPDIDFQWCHTEEEQRQAIAGAEIYSGWLSREVFLAGENLKWIHCPGTGIDSYLKIPELRDSDIPLTNAREPHVRPMATHVLGFMIMFAHRLHEMQVHQQEKKWETNYYAWRQLDLAGSSLGILGYGNIGQAVAQRAQGFEMDIYAVDKYPRESPHAKEVWGLDKLDHLLSLVDFFVVTLPITDETRGMISRERIGLMKKNAHLIVISRGGIVDEQALVEAVRSGQIAGAGLDALEPEPPDPNSPLWDTPNIILSPHASALTRDLYVGRRECFKENLRRYLAGEPFLYVCDKQQGF